MRTDSLELKEQLPRKLLLGGGPSVAQLSTQGGVGKSTLWAWLRQYRKGAGVAPGGQWPARGNKGKLAAIIATGAMNEALVFSNGLLQRLKVTYVRQQVGPA